MTEEKMNTTKYIRYLEERNVELQKERDEYDDRRREAMAETEKWRLKYFEIKKGEK